MEATRAMIPIILFICMSATLFGIFYLRNRENMALIERGINPRINYNQPKPFIYLKYGLLLIGAGIGLAIAYMLDVTVLPQQVHYVDSQGATHYQDNPIIYFALIAIGGGLGLFASYKIEKREWLDKKFKEDTEK